MQQRSPFFAGILLGMQKVAAGNMSDFEKAKLKKGYEGAWSVRGSVAGLAAGLGLSAALSHKKVFPRLMARIAKVNPKALEPIPFALKASKTALPLAFIGSAAGGVIGQDIGTKKYRKKILKDKTNAN